MEIKKFRKQNKLTQKRISEILGCHHITIAYMDKRMELAQAKKLELQQKLERFANTPREEEFKLQLEKVDALIEHLKKELEEA